MGSTLAFRRSGLDFCLGEPGPGSREWEQWSPPRPPRCPPAASTPVECPEGTAPPRTVRAPGAGFRVQGSGSGFRVQGSGFEVWCLGLRVEGLGIWGWGMGSDLDKAEGSVARKRGELDRHDFLWRKHHGVRRPVVSFRCDVHVVSLALCWGLGVRVYARGGSRVCLFTAWGR